MDLVKTARIVRRRWYMVMIGALFTLIGAAVVLMLPPTYEASSILVLLAPTSPTATASPTDGTPAPVNPYQAFDSSITITANLMSTQVTQPQIVDAMVAKGASPDYTVGTDPTTGGPTVTITAQAPTPSQALLTTHLVADEFRRQLTARQKGAGAPSRSLITASPVVTPTNADRLVAGRIRALVAIFGVGAVASVCLALAAEAIADQRRRKQAALDRPTPSTSSARDRELVGAEPSDPNT